MYTDNTILTWGKHKFTKICRIPADYLLKFDESNCPDKELLIYIEKNKDVIIARSVSNLAPPPLELDYKLSGKNLKIVCPDTQKFIFITEKEAKAEVTRILKLNQSNKKPVRAYECIKCGGWHLTSISFEEYEKRQTENSDHKNQEP